MENSKIEWTDHTVNLWQGCAKVHTGCKNCYAEALSNRFGNELWGEKANRKYTKSAFSDLDKYQRQAEKEGKKVKVFVGSMMDIFEDSKPLLSSEYAVKQIRESVLTFNEGWVATHHLRNELAARIEEGRYNDIVFLFLTKRPQNIITIPPLNNVWHGVSISNQKTANEFIPILNKLIGFKFFLSIEPQVSEISNLDLSNVRWVIQGGESGANKRPFNLEWAYQIKDMCAKAGVPYFFKQIDKVQPIPEDLQIREFPNF